MSFSPNLHDREQDKFIESPNRPGKTAVEVVIANPGDISGGGSGSSNPLLLYQLNNLEDSNPLFVGLVKSTGVWLVKKFDESTGVMVYANLSNNPLVTTYADAWSNRNTLIYNQFNILTGV